MNTVSFSEVMERVFKVFDPQMFDQDDAIYFGMEMLILLGANDLLEYSDPVEIEITGHRGILPLNIVNVTNVWNDNMIPMRYSSRRTFVDEDCDDCNDLEYFINSNYIHTNICDGKVYIQYTSIPLDDCGMPAVPDNQKIIRAISDYIIERIAFRMMLTDELSAQKYRIIKQQKDWSVASAQSEANKITPAKMQLLMNQFTRLIRLTNGDHNLYLKTHNQPEAIRNQPRKNFEA